MSWRMYFQNFFKKIFDKLGFNQYNVSSDSRLKEKQRKENVMSQPSQQDNAQNPPKSKGLFDEEFYKKYGTAEQARAYIKNNLDYVSQDPKKQDEIRKELVRKVWYSKES